MSDFFKLYRRKGFTETLEMISEFKGYEAKQSDFFKKLKEHRSYLNSFFRVKDDLIEYKIIAYKLDDTFEKVIYLTDKGKELNEKISEIEDIIKKN